MSKESKSDRQSGRQLRRSSGHPSVPAVADVLKRKVIFVSGKGGVGKTVVTGAIARALAEKGRNVLQVSFEDPLRPPGEVWQISRNHRHLNCEAEHAFEEYMEMKIGSSTLTRLFLRNKLMGYMAKAAPGIHELVLLGKVWQERRNYDAVIADMPSTGHGLAMFQSTKNFAILFKGGPIHRDAEAMIETFADPAITGHLIVALPEEMPLRESLELDQFLLEIFPENRAAFLANRLFPVPEDFESSSAAAELPDTWITPVPESAIDYARKRGILEQHNLRLWRDEQITFAGLGYVPPPAVDAPNEISRKLAEQLKQRGLL